MQASKSLSKPLVWESEPAEEGARPRGGGAGPAAREAQPPGKLEAAGKEGPAGASEGRPVRAVAAPAARTAGQALGLRGPAEGASASGAAAAPGPGAPASAEAPAPESHPARGSSGGQSWPALLRQAADRARSAGARSATVLLGWGRRWAASLLGAGMGPMNLTAGVAAAGRGLAGAGGMTAATMARVTNGSPAVASAQQIPADAGVLTTHEVLTPHGLLVGAILVGCTMLLVGIGCSLHCCLSSPSSPRELLQSGAQDARWPRAASSRSHADASSSPAAGLLATAGLRHTSSLATSGCSAVEQLEAERVLAAAGSTGASDQPPLANNGLITEGFGYRRAAGPYLNADLVVPKDSECLLQVPLQPLGLDPIEILDMHGNAVLFVRPMSLLAGPPRFVLQGRDGVPLAQFGPVQGGSEFHVYRASGDSFAVLARDAGIAERYTLTTRSGARLHFWGAFGQAAMNVTQENGQLLATTEASRSAEALGKDSSSCMLRLAPSVDVGAVLSSLLCLQSIGRAAGSGSAQAS